MKKVLYPEASLASDNDLMHETILQAHWMGNDSDQPVCLWSFSSPFTFLLYFGQVELSGRSEDTLRFECGNTKSCQNLYLLLCMYLSIWTDKLKQMV